MVKTRLLPFVEAVSFDDHVHQDHLVSSGRHLQAGFSLLFKHNWVSGHVTVEGCRHVMMQI